MIHDPVAFAMICILISLWLMCKSRYECREISWHLVLWFDIAP